MSTPDDIVGLTANVKDGTAAGAVVNYPKRRSQTAEHALYGHLRRHSGQLRDEVELLTGDVNHLDHDIKSYDLEDRASVKARRGVPALLDELASGRGMSWADIARLANVSVGAVRKWRTAGGATGGSRLALARLAAFLDLLEEFDIEDPAQWLEVPMVQNYTVTALELYRRGLQIDLLDYAGHRITAESLLDIVDNDWRSRYRSEYEVFDAADGNRSIRRKRV